MSSIGAAFAGAFLGQAYNDLGQAKSARRVLELTLLQAQGAAETQTTLAHLGELARADAGLGQTAATIARVTEVIEWVERVALTNPNSIMALHFACQWAAEQELIDLAWRGLHQLERTLAIQYLPETAACISEARGHVAIMDNDFHTAIESLSDAFDQWTAQNRPYDQVRALNGLSLALLEAGQYTEARATCEQGLQIAETLAAQLEAGDMKTSFLNSALVAGIKDRRDSL